MKKILFTMLLLAAGVMAVMTSCGGDDSGGGSDVPSVPVFSEPNVQNIQTTSATVTVTVAGNGITEYGVDYSTDATSQNRMTVKASSKNIQVTLTGLTPNTMYWVRGYAVANGNTYYSASKSFTTASVTPTPQPVAGKHVGGDISLLPKYEAAGVVYKDKDGKTVSDVLAFFKEQGMNSMRVRLFVDPSKSGDKAVCQDLEYVKTLGKRIKDAGMTFMLDFHYSDTWADPGNQWTPAAWASMNDAALATKLYEYTKDCLSQLKSAGVTPDFIQTGNEISYGMLWGTKAAVGGEDNRTNRCYIDSPAADWNRFFTFLKQAAKACREECPNARIILHSERIPAINVLTDYFDRMKSNGIDYDIIGLSYYPDHHGNLNTMENAIKAIEAKGYGRDIMIVETGYGYKWGIGNEYDYTSTYPRTEEGQRKFTADLIAKLNAHSSVKGLYWWWPEDNGNKNVTSGWWNAGLYNHDTGKPYAALYELKNFK